MVNESMGQHSDMDESTLRDWQLDEVFLPSFILEEKDTEEENSSENKREGLNFQLFSLFEKKREFPGSDELVEQGIVRKVDLTQDTR